MPLSSVLGAQSITKPGVCTSTTRPASPYDGQVIYMTDVDQTAVWDGSAWVVLAPVAGGRNLVVNGGMDVWQRGTTFNSISNTAYAADRWWVVTDAVTTVNVTQQAISSQGLGFTNCLRAERSSGTNRWVVGTNLETTAVNRLKGQTVTLSFYLRKGSGLSSDISVALATKSTEAKFGSNVDSTTITVTNASINTSTFTRFSGTLTVPANTSALGVAIEFSATQAGASNAYFEITGVQLETGSVATPFEFEDHGVTFVKCQRYYQTVRSLYNNLLGMYSDGTNKFHGQQIAFPTTMRIAPTMAFVTTIAGGFSWVIPSINIYSASNTNNITFTTSASHWAIQQTRTAGGGTPARGDVFTLESDSVFSADAEL